MSVHNESLSALTSYIRNDILVKKEARMMQHLIFGSGLIGSYLGSVMTLNNASVSFVARGSWEQRLSLPLQLTDYLNNKARVDEQRVVAEPLSTPPDVVWLTVKCTALASACEALTDWVGPDTVIVCCQNGISAHAEVKRFFPHHEVLRAMVPFNVVIAEEQHLHKGSEGTLVIEQSADSDFTESLVNTVSHPLLAAMSSDNIEAVQWAKLQLNLGNGVNALADIPVKTMLENRYYRKVIAALMTELLTVARAKKLSLPKVARLPGFLIPWVLRLPDSMFRLVAKQMLAIDPTVKTSMWWDLHNHKATERDYLYGALVRAGEAVAVPCPVNALLNILIAEAERDNKATQYTPLPARAMYKQVQKVSGRPK
ncbi:2-dehydropantoate 2-reductase [Alteromonas sp. H39]|uniref:2-dehydropantoate 2-reductase n=1 Tax=Alteromonas sp. H39 TaxID=3389876 RepID=UPI0039E0ABE4